jgi:Flp pilus assembly protein protease CpaA
MLMMSAPGHLLFLVSVAIVGALFIVGEMLKRNRAERPIPVPTKEQ